MLINHFIIPSRAYSQQSPNCTRVNNLVYIFSIQHSRSLSADHACSWKRFCPCLYYTTLYVLCKTLTSPNLTLRYHLMINLLSSHDNSHHHMMNIIYLVKEWDFLPLCLHDVWSVKMNFNIACAPGTHSVLKQNFSNHNIISFNPWINHRLLYVVDSTNR